MDARRTTFPGRRLCGAGGQRDERSLSTAVPAPALRGAQRAPALAGLSFIPALRGARRAPGSVRSPPGAPRGFPRRYPPQQERGSAGQRGRQTPHQVLPWGLLSAAKGQRLGFLPAPRG